MSEDKTTPGEVAFAVTMQTHNHPTRFWESYVSSNAGLVAKALGTTEEEAQANAQKIVLAWNGFDDLRDALVGVLRVADRKTDVFDRARAALRKAGVVEKSRTGQESA